MADIAYDANYFVKGLVACSSTAFFVYEIIITLGEEIEYVWRSKWGLPKALYLVSRYFGLVTLIAYTAAVTFDFANMSGVVCVIWQDVILLMVMILGTVVDGLLVIRVLALYSLRPRSRLFLKVLYILENCAQYTLMLVATVETVMKRSDEQPETTGCSSTTNTLNLMVIMGLLPSLIFNVVLFLFTAYALLPFWDRTSRTPLFELFLRDGSLYVLIVGGTEFLFMLITYFFRDQAGLTLVATGWVISVVPVSSCRLMLSLRGSLRAPQTGTTMDVSRMVPSAIVGRNRSAGHTESMSQTEGVMLDELN